MLASLELLVLELTALSLHTFGVGHTTTAPANGMALLEDLMVLHTGPDSLPWLLERHGIWKHTKCTAKVRIK